MELFMTLENLFSTSKHYFLFNSLLFSIYSSSGMADETHSTHLETITVIGNEATENAEVGGTPIKELPINVHVVSEEEIERLRFVDPDELLDRIPGETQVRNLRIPNGGKSYTIPLIDGIPLENPYEGATQRIDRVNTSDIQRIEVIKGPSSALYPNNAFGGVINVVTREAPLEPETTIWAEGGSFNRERTGINTGGTINKLGYFIDLNLRNLDGLREGVKNDRDQFSGKLIYDATDNTRLITRLERFKEDVVARGDLTAEEISDDPKQAGSLSSSEKLEQDTLSFKVEHLLNNGNIDFSLVYREKDTEGISRFRGEQEENDVGISSKFLYRHDFSVSNVITGFETYNGEQDTDRLLRGTLASIDSSLDINAYFIQYEADVTQKFGITMGARYEDINISSRSSDSSAASGSASFSDTALKSGLTYDLSHNTMLWLGISEGFYAPDISDIYGTGDARTINLNLKPEESTNIEIGLRGTSGSWSYDTSYYHNEIKNALITQEFGTDADPFERTTNAGQVTVQGLESVIEYEPQNTNWRAGFTHTYARNTYDSFVSNRGDFSGNELSRSPRHHFNGRLAFLPVDKLVIELEGDFYSTYYSDNANSSAGKFKRDERINLRVSYEYKSWNLWLHGLNLTDTLEDRATYSRGQLKFRTIDGRTFYAGVSYHF